MMLEPTPMLSHHVIHASGQHALADALVESEKGQICPFSIKEIQHHKCSASAEGPGLVNSGARLNAEGNFLR